MKGLVRCPANYAPLSPISFLERAAKVYRDRTSVVYGSLKFTWKETFVRCVKLASALAQLGISRGHVVATLAPNVPAMQELHFAVPMAGAVLCTLNTRHDSIMISVLLQHSEAKIIFVDHQLLHVAQGASDLLAEKNIKPPILVQIPEHNTTLPLVLFPIPMSMRVFSLVEMLNLSSGGQEQNGILSALTIHLERLPGPKGWFITTVALISMPLQRCHFME
ncbi:UNVERIFIED_CONTAM: putative acyl-activating enzyme 1, peroxisomal [Sesamum calycinum]|uniref:Acyl-activating enzyme 1, peroxisomal n=1 Tax=Sesamum calycinum TaxID=2727403 RepID=A0AAW2NE52_9LAMI